MYLHSNIAKAYYVWESKKKGELPRTHTMMVISVTKVVQLFQRFKKSSQGHSQYI